ncbi:MAG: DMT family transporter [Oscillospiraceae bacterium]|nr:DMT family transporter [Oscillospiraceae bacterium]
MLYLVLAILSSAAMAIVLKCFREQKGNRYGILLGNYLTCVVISVIMLPDKGLILSGNWITLICGIGGGIFFVLALVCMQSSIRVNGAGLSSAFARLGLIVALGLSILLFREQPTAMQFVGIGLAMAAIVVLRSDGTKQQRRRGGFGLLLLTLCASGCADAMAKVFESYGSKAQDSLYFFWLFITAILLCGALALVEKKKTGKGFRPGEFAAGVLVGIPNYFSSYLLLRSLQELRATVVYPTYSTATILLVMGLSALFFRERLTKRQWPGILLILAAIVLLNIRIS